MMICQPSGSARVLSTASCLRQAFLVDKEGGGLRLRDAMRKRHRLGCGGCLVEERGIGDIERW